MSLQYKFFIIPVTNAPEAEAELNLFLRSVRVLTMHREFVSQGGNSFWSMVVEYLPNGAHPGRQEGDKSGRTKIDYREILAPDDFVLFAKLREWRKEVASQEAAPVYTIFTNDQLAQIAGRRMASITELREIDGVGEARVSKYGAAVLALVAQDTEAHKGKAAG